MKIQGIISNKVQKTGKNGPYYRYTLEGKDYNCFESDIFNKIEIGANVLMETKISGKYDNMVSMEAVGDVPVEKPGLSGDAPYKNRPDEPKAKEYHLTEESCRAEAMKCALKSYELLKITKWDKDHLIALADEMLVYIKGGAE